jgi:hypothetical protein
MEAVVARRQAGYPALDDQELLAAPHHPLQTIVWLELSRISDYKRLVNVLF